MEFSLTSKYEVVAKRNEDTGHSAASRRLSGAQSPLATFCGLGGLAKPSTPVTSAPPAGTSAVLAFPQQETEFSFLSLRAPQVTSAEPPPHATNDANKAGQASERQQFLLEQRRLQRAFHWGAIIVVTRFIEVTLEGLTKTKLQDAFRNQMSPIVLLGLRKWLRRARLRLLRGSMTVPSVASIRNDKMLGLFSEAHIQYLIDKMKPRYYFPLEGIIFMGCEDDECYVLASGSADVLMGKTKVFTMTSGMVFGSVGMISGEPRTATIVAREPCLVWYVTRQVFESYETRDHQVAAAQTIIRELRQKNIRSVYKALIDPEFLLAKFSVLKGCSTETASMLLAKSEPRVIKHGELLQTPCSGTQHGASDTILVAERFSELDNEVMFVLRGKVRVLVDRKALLSGGKTIEEHLTFLLELATKRLPGENVDLLSKWATQFSSTKVSRKAVGSREVVAELSGPMLINVPALLLDELSPLVVETVGGCDVLVFGHDVWHRLPPDDLTTLNQNALNIHCPFVKPCTRSSLLRTVFHSSLSFDFLSSIHTSAIWQRPFVYAPNSKLRFGLGDGVHGENDDPLEARRGENVRKSVAHDGQNIVDPFTLYIVNGGTITSSDDWNNNTALEPPFMWPDVTQAFFGCDATEAVCSSRVEAIRIARCDLIEALLVALSESQLDTLMSALTNLYVAKYGRRPYFEPHGIHPTKGSAQSRLKYLVNSSREHARMSRPVHVIKPPAAATKPANVSPRTFPLPQSSLSSPRPRSRSGGADDSDADIESVPSGDALAAVSSSGFLEGCASSAPSTPKNEALTERVASDAPARSFDAGARNSPSRVVSSARLLRARTNVTEFSQGSRDDLASQEKGDRQHHPPLRTHSSSPRSSPQPVPAANQPQGPGLRRNVVKARGPLTSHGSVMAQKATSGIVTMKFSGPSRGQDRAHVELAEFFS